MTVPNFAISFRLKNAYSNNFLKPQQRDNLGNSYQPYGSILYIIRKSNFRIQFHLLCQQSSQNLKLRKAKDLFNIEI